MSKSELADYKKKNKYIEHEPSMDKLRFIEMSINK